MKICQYNIYFGNHPEIQLSDRMRNVCQCILKQDADVVCLQEVLQTTFDLIVNMLENKYPYTYPDIEDGLTFSYGTLILSRYPINRATTHCFEYTSMGRDIKLITITDDNDDKYYICTSHFESEFKNNCMTKIFQYTRCAEILYQLYQKTNIPIILCADTNVCQLSESAFYNAFSYAKGWKD